MLLIAYQAAVIELVSFGLLAALVLVLNFGDAWRSGGLAIPLGIALIAGPALIYALPLFNDALTWSWPSQLLMITALITSMYAYAYGTHHHAPGVALLSGKGDSGDNTATADKSGARKPRSGGQTITLVVDESIRMVIIFAGIAAWFLVPLVFHLLGS